VRICIFGDFSLHVPPLIISSRWDIMPLYTRAYRVSPAFSSCLDVALAHPAPIGAGNRFVLSVSFFQKIPNATFFLPVEYLTVVALKVPAQYIGHLEWRASNHFSDPHISDQSRDSGI
jgi:hypothetical protein